MHIYRLASWLLLFERKHRVTDHDSVDADVHSICPAPNAGAMHIVSSGEHLRTPASQEKCGYRLYNPTHEERQNNPYRRNSFAFNYLDPLLVISAARWDRCTFVIADRCFHQFYEYIVSASHFVQGLMVTRFNI
jgi:hypothetical protein